MIFKTDWQEHLHKIRRKETEIAFSPFGGKKFESGLEVGCGDGFQTSIIASHFEKFSSADLNFDRIKIKAPGVDYVKVDGDNISGSFGPEQFDVIFSSSFLEHLSDPRGFLRNSRDFLKKDGYAIHIVPNRFMKLAYISMFYPNLLVLILDRLSGLFKGKKIFRGEGAKSENNINLAQIGRDRREGRFKKIFLPSIHGMYNSHWEEYKEWGSKQWEKMFSDSGYKIIRKMNTSAHSGYGFGFDSIRKLFEWLGVSSLTVYVLQKNG